MRVRDIVRRSFEKLVTTGVLPSYERQGRYAAPPPRFNSPWRPEQLEILHHGSAQGPLYDDPERWRAAVEFIKSFAAGAVSAGELPWRIDAFCGSFGVVPDDDLLHLATAILTGRGFQAIGSNKIAKTGWFEASDSPTVRALPEPYGKWLQLIEGRPRWQEPVALRLTVQVHARIVPRPDGRFDGFIDIAMSAPATALLDILARDLGHTPPTLCGHSWLPKPDRPLHVSKGHPHARRI